MEPTHGTAAVKRRRWSVAALLFVATAAAYARVIGHPFILFDDNRYVSENPVVQHGLTWEGVHWAWTTMHVANWHPLTWLSHMADVSLFGLAPAGHHAVNVFLHALNAALLFLLLARMTGAQGRSAFVAALFALHPTHVESVAWVAERKDVLSTFFGLLALLGYVGWARRGGTGRYLLVLASFGMSLLAKPMLVTLPFLMLLLDFWPLQRVSSIHLSRDLQAPFSQSLPPVRLVVEKVPLLALSVASSMVTFIAQARSGAVRGMEISVWERLGNAAGSYVRYAGKTFWPSPLAIFYPFPREGFPAWKALAAVALLAIASFVAVRAARQMPWIFVGWYWFLGTLVPVIGLVQVGSQAIADRYTYFPTTGLFVAFTWTAASLATRLHRETTAAIGGAVLLATLAALSFVQMGHWSSHEKLFRHTLSVEPDGALAHGVLSEGLRRAGRTLEALDEAREATRLEPHLARHWHNLGVSLRDAGLIPEARDAFAEAVRVDPAYLPGWSNLAQAELDLGRPEAALASLEQAIARGSDSPFVWSNAAVLYQASGRVDQAGRAFEMVTRLQPGSLLAWRNLGIYWVRNGRPGEAERAFARALEIDPANPDVRQRLDAIRMGAR
jgi:protein O-mannosyl-transferase